MQSDSLNPAITSNNNKIPVFLNVYHFWPWFNCCCEPLGLGVYHTGVQIYDDEYMFFGFDGDETGVGYIEPYSAAYTFSEQILLGYVDHSFMEFDEEILDPLRAEFIGNSYDLLQNNCNHFSKKLTQQLRLQDGFPPKIFRITNFCNVFRCCIPDCILNGRLDWFDWGKPNEEESGYHELYQSIIKPKEKEGENIKAQRFSGKYSLREELQQGQTHPEIPKQNTLRKGIWPHTGHSHNVGHHENEPIEHKHLQDRLSSKKSDQRQREVKYPNEQVQIYKTTFHQKEELNNSNTKRKFESAYVKPQ